MRLIDADELIKDRVENDPVVIAVKCAKTAFDKEKVVEELEGKARYYLGIWRNFEWGQSLGKSEAYKEAAGIVEKGGVENA